MLTPTLYRLAMLELTALIRRGTAMNSHSDYHLLVLLFSYKLSDLNHT